MYVTRIEGTVKGTVSAELGRLTLIVGPNGSGKSRIVNTLELALMGFASDVVGRTEMRKEGELIALAAGDELIAKATLSDGRVSVWETAKTKTGAKRADHVQAVAAEFPVTEVREALTGSVETARKWLLQRVAAAVSRPDVTKYLPSDEAVTAYEQKAKFVHGSEVDVLVGVLESAKAEKRAKATQQTTIGKNIASLSSGLAAEPTEAQIQAAQQNADDALAAYRSAIEKNAVSRVQPLPLEPAAAKVQELVALAEQAAVYREARVTALANAGGPLGDTDGTLIQMREKLLDVLHMHDDLGSTTCLICSSPLLPNALLSKKTAIQSALEKVATRRELEKSIGEAEEIVRTVAAKLQAAESEYARLQAAWANFEQASPSDSTASVADAEATLRAANAALTSLQQTATAWKSVRSLKQEEREAKKYVSTLEELIEGCKEAVEAILKSATSTFIARVQSFLPPTDEFALVLNDGEREVCRFGFLRNGVLHTALSGAEWARLTIALACATSTAAPDVLRVFVPEDRAFDANTLRDVLVGLANAPGQVIIATTTKPAGRLPKGWTLIETGATE
jgi:hypothetical protein